MRIRWRLWSPIAIFTAIAGGAIPLVASLTEERTFGLFREGRLETSLAWIALAAFAVPLLLRLLEWDRRPRSIPGVLAGAALVSAGTMTLGALATRPPYESASSQLAIVLPSLAVTASGFGFACLGRGLRMNLLRAGLLALASAAVLGGGWLLGSLRVFRELPGDVDRLPWQVPAALAFPCAAAAIAASRRLRGKPVRTRIVVAGWSLMAAALIPSDTLPRTWKRSDIRLVMGARLADDGGLIVLAATHANLRGPSGPFAVLRCEVGREDCALLTRRPLPLFSVNQGEPLEAAPDGLRFIAMERAAPWQWVFGIESFARLRSSRDGAVIASTPLRFWDGEGWALAFGPGDAWAMRPGGTILFSDRAGRKRRIRVTPGDGERIPLPESLAILPTPCEAGAGPVRLTRIAWDDGQAVSTELAVDGSPCAFWNRGSRMVISVAPEHSRNARCLYSVDAGGTTRLLAPLSAPYEPEPFIDWTSRGPAPVSLDAVPALRELANRSLIETRTREIRRIRGVPLLVPYGYTFHGAVPDAVFRLSDDLRDAENIARPSLSLQWRSDSLVYIAWAGESQQVVRYFPETDRREVLMTVKLDLWRRP